MMALLNIRLIGTIGIVAAVAAACLYVTTLQHSLARAREDIEKAAVLVDAYKSASETAVRQAAFLETSREAAEADRRSAEDRVRAAEDACLDQPLPAGLLD
jgi:hypothetical protein